MLKNARDENRIFREAIGLGEFKKWPKDKEPVLGRKTFIGSALYQRSILLLNPGTGRTRFLWGHTKVQTAKLLEISSIYIKLFLV